MNFTDQLGRTITLEKIPQRIISLVPSQTELLADLRLEKEVIGITKFCIHPESWFRSKIRIGGTKQFSFEKIAALNPDLIIGNKEENEQEQIEALMKLYPVWMSDIKTLEDAEVMIKSVGELTGKKSEGEIFAEKIKSQFDIFKNQISGFKKRRVAYFIWKNPWMVAGENTFIDHLLKLCGWENVFTGMKSRYPEISLQDLFEKSPELILLSSEPYPFKEKHVAELNVVLPDAKILTVDGELFSWYGTRLLHSPSYFLDLMNSLEKNG
jgi:ABC-type Fe3+-hydroxamate transport system substrate-binding protein